MIKVNYDKCIKCKLCIKDCFPENIIFENEKIKIKDNCIMCGHCVAICPTKAINFENENYSSPEELKDLDYKIDPKTFLNFVKARRSIRHFKDKKIEKEIFEKLLEVGRYSPTGANVQDVKYYFIQDNLDEYKSIIWEGLKTFLNSDDLILKRYRDLFGHMYNSKENDDKLFFNAPTLLVITSSNKINGILAADKIELMANMMGLGVLFSGFIEMAINSSEALIKKFGLKRNVTCACMLLGYPSITYKRTAPRKKVNAKFL